MFILYYANYPRYKTCQFKILMHDSRHDHDSQCNKIFRELKLSFAMISIRGLAFFLVC